MTTQLRLPNADQAHATIVGIHKRAFFGRLAQYGITPQNEKEAAALLDLGVGLMEYQESPDGSLEKAAAADQNFDYGNGPYAQCLRAFDQVTGNTGAPGFEGVGKSASLGAVTPEPAQLPQALVDSAYQAALELARSPNVYGAAVVKRAQNEQQMFEWAKEAGLVDNDGNVTELGQQQGLGQQGQQAQQAAQ